MILAKLDPASKFALMSNKTTQSAKDSYGTERAKLESVVGVQLSVMQV
jgi:hypothetical protein